MLTGVLEFLLSSSILSIRACLLMASCLMILFILSDEADISLITFSDRLDSRANEPLLVSKASSSSSFMA